jgi:hypothetical protein
MYLSLSISQLQLQSPGWVVGYTGDGVEIINLALWQFRLSRVALM